MMSSDIIEKSVTDYRNYRIITLANGLKTVLVSDLKPDEPCPNNDLVEGDSDEDDGNSSEDNSEEEEQDPSRQRCESDCPPKQHQAQKGKQKSAAALCVSVGGLNDPQEIQGLAHYMEHMVFMGSTKYPSENDFDAYISARGGETNAWTDAERTCFYFDIKRASYYEALDRFANFFISPLLNKDSLDRELTAVHSEYEMQLSNDSFVSEMILLSTSKSESPFRNFQSGNKTSLREVPNKKGINVYEYLHDLRKRMYSAHFMTLAVISKDTLDHMEEMVKKIFSDVPNNGLAMPSLAAQHVDPFDTPEFKKFYIVSPIKDEIHLNLTWCLPSVLTEYKCQPTGILGFVIGHEGKGSLISYLRKKNLGLELTAGSTRLPDGNNTSIACLFVISIKLTEQGYSAVNEVIDAVFSYLAMFRSHGVQSELFEEFQQLSYNRFLYHDLSEPIESVEFLAQALHVYPDQHIHTGNMLAYEYKPEIYHDLLHRLTADKANFMLIARCHDAECTKTEPWYNGRYNTKDLAPELLKRWCDAVPEAYFHLPSKNKFIATNFDLLPIDGHDKPPVNLSSQLEGNAAQYGSLWYKKDHVFRVPKAIVYLMLWSNLGQHNFQDNVLNSILVYALEQELNEVAYDAEEASLEYSLECFRSGIKLKLSGFNDKLHLLLDTIITYIVNFKSDPDRFISYQENQRQSYYNQGYKPGKLARDLHAYFTQDRAHTCIEKLTVLQKLSSEDLTLYHKQFLKKLRLDIYVHGNISEKEALQFFQTTKEKLTCEPLLETDVVRTCSLQMPEGDSRVRIMNINNNDVNTVVLNYYQMGLVDLKLKALNDLAELVLQEPCFDFLRTKETLGYSVGLYSHSISGCLAICLIVMSQADKFSIDHCHTKMEHFLFHMAPKIVTDLTDKEFDTYINTLISMNQLEDVHMGGEARRNWDEISTGAPLFDRRKKMINIFKTLKKSDLIDFVLKHYLNVSGMKKLSIEINANPDAKEGPSPSTSKSYVLDVTPVVANDSHHRHPKGPQVKWMTNLTQTKTSFTPNPYHVINE